VITQQAIPSINDSWFGVRMHEEYVVDHPSAMHGGGDWLSFADGHVEFHRWQDPRTSPAYRHRELIPLNIPSPGNVDMAWLRERTTDKKPGAPL
jgi:hypothetical protein